MNSTYCTCTVPAYCTCTGTVRVQYRYKYGTSIRYRTVLYECTEGGDLSGRADSVSLLRYICYRPSPHIEPQLPIYPLPSCLLPSLESSRTFSQYRTSAEWQPVSVNCGASSTYVLIHDSTTTQRSTRSRDPYAGSGTASQALVAFSRRRIFWCRPAGEYRNCNLPVTPKSYCMRDTVR